MPHPPPDPQSFYQPQERSSNGMSSNGYGDQEMEKSRSRSTSQHQLANIMKKNDGHRRCFSDTDAAPNPHSSQPEPRPKPRRFTFDQPQFLDDGSPRVVKKPKIHQPPGGRPSGGRPPSGRPRHNRGQNTYPGRSHRPPQQIPRNINNSSRPPQHAAPPPHSSSSHHQQHQASSPSSHSSSSNHSSSSLSSHSSSNHRQHHQNSPPPRKSFSKSRSNSNHSRSQSQGDANFFSQMPRQVSNSVPGVAGGNLPPLPQVAAPGLPSKAEHRNNHRSKSEGDANGPPNHKAPDPQHPHTKGRRKSSRGGPGRPPRGARIFKGRRGVVVRRGRGRGVVRRGSSAPRTRGAPRPAPNRQHAPNVNTAAVS